jgi:hypothetical protein
MPIYLWTLLRVLSSWVHRGEIAESARSRPGLHDFSRALTKGTKTRPLWGRSSGAKHGLDPQLLPLGLKGSLEVGWQLPEQVFGEAARSRFRPATQRQNRLLTNLNPRRGSQLPAEEEITDERIDELG